MRAERGQMFLAWAMAALTIYAARDASSVSSRRAVTGVASLFQIRSEYPAQGRFIRRGLLFGKTKLQRQPVLLRIVKVSGLHQSRTRQRQAVQSVIPDQKTDPVSFAADVRGFNRKIERRLSWHLHLDICMFGPVLANAYSITGAGPSAVAVSE